jgi:hypothetical protein
LRVRMAHQVQIAPFWLAKGSFFGVSYAAMGPPKTSYGISSSINGRSHDTHS